MANSTGHEGSVDHISGMGEKFRGSGAGVEGAAQPPCASLQGAGHESPTFPRPARLLYRQSWRPQVKHEEFKQGADQRASAQGQEVRRLQEQLEDLQRANAKLRGEADQAAREANMELQVVQGQMGQLQVGAQAGVCLMPRIGAAKGWLHADEAACPAAVSLQAVQGQLSHRLVYHGAGCFGSRAQVRAVSVDLELWAPLHGSPGWTAGRTDLAITPWFYTWVPAAWVSKACHVLFKCTARPPAPCVAHECMPLRTVHRPNFCEAARLMAGSPVSAAVSSLHPQRAGVWPATCKLHTCFLVPCSFVR